jgi:hypothetical protein
VRFRLRFQGDSENQTPVLLQGNREQLESLRVAVDTYIQNFLASSPESLFLPSLAPETDAQEDSVVMFPKVELTEAEDSSVSSPVSQTSPESSGNQLPAQPIIRSHNFSHELFLGNLASETTGTSLTLSFLQLRDLAAVLGEYHHQMMALPDSTQTSSSLAKNPVVLFGSAAAILVAVGVTYTAVRMGNSTSQVEGQVAGVDAEEDSLEFADPSLIEVPPLELPTQEGTLPSPTPTDGLETLPSPGQTDILPPSEPSNPGSANPGTTSDFLQTPTLPNRNSQQQTPRTSASLPTAPPTTLTRPSLSGRAISPDLPNIPSNTPPSPASPPPTRASAPQPTPQVPPNPPSLPEYSPPPEGVQDLYGIATAPNTASSIPGTAPSPSGASGSEETVDTSETSETSTETAAASLPQIREIQSYFEQRWEPPASLDESIEYILYLSQDGTLERIIPIGETAKTYIDQTNLPLLNEPFVSELNREGTPQVRVVLNPDGEVQTFLEAAN